MQLSPLVNISPLSGMEAFITGPQSSILYHLVQLTPLHRSKDCFSLPATFVSGLPTGLLSLLIHLLSLLILGARIVPVFPNKSTRPGKHSTAFYTCTGNERTFYKLANQSNRAKTGPKGQQHLESSVYNEVAKNSGFGGSGEEAEEVDTLKTKHYIG